MGDPVLLEVDECGSTQELALALHRAGTLPVWGGLLTRRQNAGRGRRGRQWTLGLGSLALTAVLPAPLPGEEPGLVPLRVALAVLDACGCKALELKWPNDLVVTLPLAACTPPTWGATEAVGSGTDRARAGGVPGWGRQRKLGGILCEVDGGPGDVGVGAGGEQADAAHGGAGGAGAHGGAGGAEKGVVLAGIGINLAAFGQRSSQQVHSDPNSSLTRDGADMAAALLAQEDLEMGAPAPWAMSAAHAGRLLGDRELAQLSLQSPAGLAARILGALPGALALPASDVLRRYESKCVTIGQQVRVTLSTTGQPGPADVAGRVSAISASGALLVASQDGTKEVVAGDVSVRYS